MFGGVVTAALGIVWKILKFVLGFVAKVVCYFGLYIPLAYLIYGAVLYFVFDFGLFVGGVDGRLYIFGFVLCLVCSVIITVRSLIVKPLERYFGGDVIEYAKKGVGGRTPEAPTIYKSKVNPGVIVYEYANRYDLYEKRGDGLVLVKTEWKKKKR